MLNLMPLLLLGLWLPACRSEGDLPTSSAPGQVSLAVEPLHIVWVNSYRADDPWSLQIQSGVLEMLARSGYSIAEDTLVWDALHMGVAQHISEREIEPIAEDMVAKIEELQPDLVMVSDDEAARAVIPRYPHTDMPFVFCGLNGDLVAHDLVRPNVTGVLETLRPVETVKIARAFVGNTGNYMLLSDASPANKDSAVHAFQELVADDPAAPRPEFWMTARWQMWQELVLGAEDLDFIVLVSSNFVWDNVGRYVEQEELMAWMVENSPVPVFALSNQAVFQGAVAGLVPYGYDQGVAAAEIAVQIVQGSPPASIDVTPAQRNLLVMNLAAAYNWNLPIPIAFPLAARVYRTLPATQGGQ